MLIDLAIVGAGSMGANHARVGLGLRDARISAIVDPDPERGGKLATTVGAAYYPDVTGLPATVDAAVVAVPTDLHVPVSTELLAMGKHVLVEKPIARTVADARFLVGAARDAGKILMVGHVERFNPAVVELAAIVAEPIHIDAQRVSAFVGRIREGVVLDLMTHDLDIVTALVNQPVVEVQASVSTLALGDGGPRGRPAPLRRRHVGNHHRQPDRTGQDPPDLGDRNRGVLRGRSVAARPHDPPPDPPGLHRRDPGIPPAIAHRDSVHHDPG